MMKRRFFSVLLAVLLVHALLPLAAAAECTAVYGANFAVVKGETVDYTVSISGNPGIAGYHIKLSYDTSVFIPETDGSGEIICDTGSVSSVSPTCTATSSGCQILWYNTSDATEDGVLFRLHFSVSEEAEDRTYPIQISYVARNTINADEKLVPLNCVDGSITVREYEQLIYGTDTTVLQRKQFCYTVSMQDNPGIAGYMIKLSYDKTMLAPDLDASDATALTPVVDAGAFGGTLSARITTTGMTVLWYNTQNVTADGPLFTLHFTVTEEAAAGEYPITLSYEKPDTIDENGTPVTFAVRNSVITVEEDPSIEVHVESAAVSDGTVSVTLAGYTSLASNAVIAAYDQNGKLLDAHFVPVMTEENVLTTTVSTAGTMRYTVYLVDRKFRPVSANYSF